jgi:hypothetical protein
MMKSIGWLGSGGEARDIDLHKTRFFAGRHHSSGPNGLDAASAGPALSSSLWSNGGLTEGGRKVDWSGWAIYGVVATMLLTAVLVGAQLAGLTRLDMPLMLGTLLTGDPDRARFWGFFLHLSMGQFFALFYAAVFAELGRSGLWLGAGFGVVHAAVAGAVLVPLLPTIHPRMATERAGPTSISILEPPGLLALNYGWSTPLVTMAAHAVYGAVLGLLVQVQ